jgi:hypothetical protein
MEGSPTAASGEYSSCTPYLWCTITFHNFLMVGPVILTRV